MDTSIAFTARLAESSKTVRIELRTFGDLVTYFGISWLDLEPSFWHPERARRTERKIAHAWIYFALLLTMCMAVNNWRQHRFDRKGTFRICVLILGLRVVIAACVTKHGYAEIGAFVSMFAWLIYPVVLTAIGYIAIEPYLRRLWPEVLVSWNRLLTGRWSNAMVGRDVLVAVLAGVVNEVCLRIPAALAISNQGTYGPIATAMLKPLEGPPEAIGVVAAILSGVIIFNLMFLAFLLCLRLWFKTNLDCGSGLTH